MEKTFAADLLRAVKDGHQKLTSMALTKPFGALLGVSSSSYIGSDLLRLFFKIYIYIPYSHVNPRAVHQLPILVKSY